MTTETSDRVLERLSRLHPKLIDLSLGRIERLLGALDNPQERLPPVVHVAGTNGKGSTIATLRACLEAGGYSAHVYTSPHLVRFHERIRLAGKLIEEEVLIALLEECERANRGEPITFFEITNAAAFLAFSRVPADVVLLEVGLGGRLDSTNVVRRPAVTAITPISLDHQALLGNTIAQIAGEKAGILKRGRPAVVGALPPDALGVVEARARALGAPLSRLGREFSSEVSSSGASGVRLGLRDGSLEVETVLSTLGAHQAANAALALACVRRATPGLSNDALARAAEAGLAAARLPGRVELLGRRPWLVVDGAHTVESARALADALQSLARRRSRLVLSVSGGKDLAGILSVVLSSFDEIFVTRADAQRSLDPLEVADAIRAAGSRATVHAVPNPFLALRAAREGLCEQDLLCATGSLYLAGIARQVLAGQG